MLLNSAVTATTMAVLVLGLLYAGWTIHRLRIRLARALHAATHDPLTDLPNRRGVQQLFDSRAAARHATVLALLDLDRFKQVNDTYGHHAGDQLLTALAGRLAIAAARYGGHAARLAGDEFVLLLPAQLGDPVEPVASILAEITTPVPLAADPAGTYTPRPTAGITVFDGVDGTWTTVLRRVDIACYHAKARRSGYEVFHPGMTMPAAPGQRGLRLRDLHEQAPA